MTGDDAYRAAVAREQSIFENCLKLHDLPEIYHYWAHRFIRTKVLPYGFDSPDGMFRKYLAEKCAEPGNEPKQFVSLGSGNCDLEITLARELRALGHERFVIDCVDLNPVMLERGRVGAEQAGLADCVGFVQADFNDWTPTHDYDAVVANQSLHHVLNLEGLFARVKESLKPGASFIISDMIGRNGHQRWPEALELVHEFWRQLPPSYRFNPDLGRYEEMFRDRDCSDEGFEGVRAQDVLPLLLTNFHFRLFVPFGNVIDPFVDRSFGHHFDATAAWDRSFIDAVHERDESGMAAGLLTPTHMLAVVGNERDVATVFPGNLSPQFCVRDPERSPRPGESHPKPLDSGLVDMGRRGVGWPHDPLCELEIACHRLGQTEDRAIRAEQEAEKVTEWALRLQKELDERTAWAVSLRDDVEERTAWALRLQKEVEQRDARVRQMQSELEDAATNTSVRPSGGGFRTRLRSAARALFS